MRRKSERSKKTKSSPEKKVEKAKRGRTSRRRKHSSSSDHESAEEVVTEVISVPDVVAVVEKTSPVKQQTPTKEQNPDDKPDQVWQVKTAETSGNSGEIKKLKICLTRPPSTPERPDRSPRGRKKLNRNTSSSDTPSVDGVEEKKKTRHRNRRVTRESREDGEKNQDSQCEEPESEQTTSEDSRNDNILPITATAQPAADDVAVSTTSTTCDENMEKEHTDASKVEVAIEKCESSPVKINDCTQAADTTVDTSTCDKSLQEQSKTSPISKLADTSSEAKPLPRRNSLNDTKSDNAVESTEVNIPEEIKDCSQEPTIKVDAKLVSEVTEQPEKKLRSPSPEINNDEVGNKSSDILLNRQSPSKDSTPSVEHKKMSPVQSPTKEEILQRRASRSDSGPKDDVTSEQMQPQSTENENITVSIVHSDSKKESKPVSESEVLTKSVEDVDSKEPERAKRDKRSHSKEKVKDKGDDHSHLPEESDLKLKAESVEKEQIVNNNVNCVHLHEEHIDKNIERLDSKEEESDNYQPTQIIVSRKRRWGSRPSKVGKPQTVAISTDVLKDIIPDVKPVEFDEVIKEQKHKKIESAEKSERPILPKIIIDNTEQVNKHRSEKMQREQAKTHELPPPLSHRKISIVKENDSIINRPPSPPRHKSSSILYISNLVRPFTLPQLKNLLQRTGKIADNGFWIDRIKSKCYVQYETEDQAVETRHALHGVTWPVSNPKTLQVDFSSEDALEKARSTEDATNAEASTIPGTVEDWLREQDAKRERGDMEDVKPWEKRNIVREWDVGKGEKEKEKIKKEEKPQDRRRHRTPERSPEPARKFKKKEDEAPAKLLDDLFRKTKTVPCIYWLPLSAETIAVKEEQRRQHMAEHERRLAELRRGHRAPPPPHAPRH